VLIDPSGVRPRDTQEHSGQYLDYKAIKVLDRRPRFSTKHYSYNFEQAICMSQALTTNQSQVIIGKAGAGRLIATRRCESPERRLIRLDQAGQAPHHKAAWARHRIPAQVKRKLIPKMRPFIEKPATSRTMTHPTEAGYLAARVGSHRASTG
jgi:hypothetical protein